jgi:hypothetical protein
MKNFIILSKRLPKEAYNFLIKKTITDYILSLDLDKIENKKIVLKETIPNKIELYNYFVKINDEEKSIEITNDLRQKSVKIIIELC